MSESKSIHIKLKIKGREELELSLNLNKKQEILKAELKGIGGPKFLALLETWRAKLKGPLLNLLLPKGTDTHVLLLREALLKAKGKWKLPYTKDRLCECRNIPTEEVERAILSGAKTLEEVRLWTSASTGCGTCFKHVEKLLSYRLKDFEKKKVA